MRIVAAVWLMTSRAARLVCGGMQMRLLSLVGLVGMAGQAGVHRIRLHKARRLSRMGIVASDTFALRPGMLHLCAVNLLGLLVMAGDAERLGVRLCQHHLAVFGRLVAGIAGLVRKRRMGKLLHQLGLRRLVRVVTLHAVGSAERLALVRLD